MTGNLLAELMCEKQSRTETKAASALHADYWHSREGARGALL